MEKLGINEYIFAAENGMLNIPGFESTASYSYCIDRYNRRNVQVKVTKSGIKTTKLVEISSVDNSFSLHLSDCDRKIRLSFDISDERSVKNSLFKVDTLINSLVSFKKKLISSIKIHNAVNSLGKLSDPVIFESEEELQRKLKEISEDIGVELTYKISD